MAVQTKSTQKTDVLEKAAKQTTANTTGKKTQKKAAKQEQSKLEL